MTEFDVNFGKSKFKGKHDMITHMYRWFIQFVALLMKNFVIMLRRPLQLLLYVLLPSAVIFTYLMQLDATNNSSEDILYPDIPLVGLGECDVYYHSDCLRVAYSPNTDSKINDIMNEFSSINNLVFNTDVKGFKNTTILEDYVALNIGKVQFSIIFRNTSLWETNYFVSEIFILIIS